jgi:osmotically-inducible protein OsmY
VRSKIGRVVSHPGAIEIAADQGSVTLRGPILAGEVDGLLSCVSSVKGVKGVENLLEAHEQAGGVPGLQGAG